MRLWDSNKMLSVRLRGGARDRSAEGGANRLGTVVFGAKPQLSRILSYKRDWDSVEVAGGDNLFAKAPPFGNLR